MRLFIAVPVPEELKGNIAGIQKRLARASGIRAVGKENLHFTIKLLGETDKLEEIERCMEKALEGLHQFDVEIAGASAFPSKNRARVVWLAVGNGLEDFKKLMKNIDAELSKIGFEQEKDYIPHITLARVRSGRSSTELINLIDRIGQAQIGTMQVKEVKLVKSTLTRVRHVYEEVYSVKLG